MPPSTPAPAPDYDERFPVPSIPVLTTIRVVDKPDQREISTLPAPPDKADKETSGIVGDVRQEVTHIAPVGERICLIEELDPEAFADALSADDETGTHQAVSVHPVIVHDTEKVPAETIAEAMRLVMNETLHRGALRPSPSSHDSGEMVINLEDIDPDDDETPHK